jgi:hypothetical protein
MTKLKTIILCIAAIIPISSCTVESDYTDYKTYSGYVAFEYTSNIISNYSNALMKVIQFDEYISQTTIQKRDSIDRLYFNTVKIISEENGNNWVLRDVYFNDYNNMIINTNGKNLNDENTVWLVTFYGGEHMITAKTPEFEIKRVGNGHWHIKKHDSNNYAFDYHAEWDIRFDNNDKILKIEGSGSLLSIESPKLRLDYTITEPFTAINGNYFVSIPSGKITILATDVDKNITEETIAEVISESDIKITYNNNTENYHFVL